MGWNDQNGEQGPWGARKPEAPREQSGPKQPWSGGNGSDNKGFSYKFRKPSDPSLKLPLLILLLVWLASGFYRVLPEENAVILTFGKWANTRTESGLGYHLPWPIQQDVKVNVAFDRRIEIGDKEGSMLTGDENIVDIDFVVMWRITDAKNYLFQIRDPENTVQKVSMSAMREIIARGKIQRALTEGRAEIEAKTKELAQKMLDDYQSGIAINSVQLLRVDPPAPVVDAFDDVQRARADMERAKNEAETYRNDILPRARGEAQKTMQDAEAYRDAAISRAKGEAARFNAVYESYATSKDVTAKRMYIETMQEIMKNSRKVIVGDNKVVPYLPVEGAKK